MDLIVLQRDMVLVDRVPFLDPDFLRSRPDLRSDELLQIADGVVFVALDADLLAQTVVQNHFNHAAVLASRFGRRTNVYQSRACCPFAWFLSLSCL